MRVGYGVDDVMAPEEDDEAMLMTDNDDVDALQVQPQPGVRTVSLASIA